MASPLICAAIAMTALYGCCFTWVVALHWRHQEYLAALLMAGMCGCVRFRLLARLRGRMGLMSRPRTGLAVMALGLV